MSYVIVCKNHSRKTFDPAKKAEVTPPLYYSSDVRVTFAASGVWLAGEGRKGESGGAPFTPDVLRAEQYETEEAAEKKAADLVLACGFLPGDLEMEQFKDPREGETHDDDDATVPTP